MIQLIQDKDNNKEIVMKKLQEDLWNLNLAVNRALNSASKEMMEHEERSSSIGGWDSSSRHPAHVPLQNILNQLYRILPQTEDMQMLGERANKILEETQC